MCRLRTSASCGGGIPGPHEHETQPHISQVTTDELLVITRNRLLFRVGKGGSAGAQGASAGRVGRSLSSRLQLQATSRWPVACVG
jgi:hypothetical protein